MLRIEHNGMDINVRFSHRVVETELDGERRCTWAQVIFLKTNSEFNGTATCHPKDNFSKAIGRKLALASAMRDFDRDVRKAVWEVYHEFCK